MNDDLLWRLGTYRTNQMRWTSIMLESEIVLCQEYAYAESI
jgi:hypothetical protein